MQRFMIFQDGKPVKTYDFNQPAVGKVQIAEKYPVDQFKVFSFPSSHKPPKEVEDYLKTFQPAVEAVNKKRK